MTPAIATNLFTIKQEIRSHMLLIKKRYYSNQLVLTQKRRKGSDEN